MGNGIYSAVAGSVAQVRNLEVVSNNLAHVDTPGFKADVLRFQETLRQAGKESRFVETPGTAIRMDQGPIHSTGNPLDLALEGDGFFVVDAQGGARLSRSGRMVVGPDGLLRTTAGHVVRGEAGPIAIPPAGTAGAAPLVVDPSGEVKMGAQVLGKLTRVNAPPGSLSKDGADLFASTSPIDELPESNAQVIQGSIEGANVNPVIAMTQVIEVQRTFEALQQVVRTYREVDGQSTRRLR